MKKSLVLMIAVLFLVLCISCDGSVKKVHKVEFLLDGGAGEVPSQTVSDGDKAKEPGTRPTKENFIFVEWQKDGLRYSFSDGVTEDITLTAVWTPVNPTAEDYLASFIPAGWTANIGEMLSSLFKDGSGSVAQGITEKEDFLKEKLNNFLDFGNRKYVVKAIDGKNSSGSIKKRTDAASTSFYECDNVYIPLTYTYQERENETSNWTVSEERTGYFVFSVNGERASNKLGITDVRTNISASDAVNLPDISRTTLKSYKSVELYTEGSKVITGCTLHGRDLSDAEVEKVKKVIQEYI